MKDLLNKITY